MAIVKSDPFSQVPFILKLFFDSTELAIGTGFLYKYQSRYFIISNWHNFSGRDPKSHKPLADHGGIPNKLLAYLMLKGQYVTRNWIQFTLSNAGLNCWLEHPTRSSEIDVAVLPIELPEQCHPIAINDIPMTAMDLAVSHDVFVLGYPLGLIDTMGLPIWKRASVATEPSTSSPSFLIDTATRSGMSGSPVIMRYRGFYKYDASSPTVSAEDWFGEGSNFVGVYSGRLGSTQLEAQLGIVWKQHVIDEIIAGNKSAEC